MTPRPFTPPFQIYIGSMRYGEEQHDLDTARLMARHLLDNKGQTSVITDRNGQICGETWVAR